MFDVKLLFLKIMKKIISIGKLTLVVLLLVAAISAVSIYWFETAVMDRSVPKIIQDAKYWTYPEYIQLIDFSGTIMQSENWLYHLDKIGSDPRCRAVVIQVTSPGGYTTPSLELAQGIKSFKKKYDIPVIIFGREMLASGAYYFASAADAIVVKPGTITGSIGVILIHVSLRRLYQKEGYDITVVKSGDKKDMSYSFRKPTQEELEIFESVINETYVDFVDFIIEQRNDVFADRCSATNVEVKEYVYALADGRIYNTKDALAVGLVDKVGSLEDAIKIAKRYAGSAQNIPIVTYNTTFDGFNIKHFFNVEVQKKNYYNGFHLLMRL